ncbi:MAG: amidohydrolase, partial [Oscillospiraceae bacterium]
MQIINAKIYTMCDDLIIENGYIKYNNGLISGVGDMNECVKNQDDIDAKGGWLFPGFIDAHSHLGMWEDSIDFEGDDGNEQTNPSMPHLRAIDAVNPMDKCFSEARNAGITTVITGPGSANPIGGILIAMKTCGRRVDDMLVRDPVGIKFALGENPKRAYNEKG